MLIIIWRGYGLLLAMAGAFLGIATLMLSGNLGLSVDAGFILGWLVTAAFLWFAGRALNDPSRDKELIDVGTGEPIVMRKRHSVYGIPVQYVAVLPTLMAILTTVDVIFDI